MEITHVLAAASGGAVVCGLSVYLLLNARIAVLREQLASRVEIKALLTASEERLLQGLSSGPVINQIRESESSVNAAIKALQPPIAKAPPLTVRVEPYFRQLNESGFLKKTTDVEIGYQYQLLVHEIPCFEPHVIVVEKRQESVLNEEAVERLKNYAYELAQAAVTAKVGGTTPFVKIAKAMAKRVM